MIKNSIKPFLLVTLLFIAACQNEVSINTPDGSESISSDEFLKIVGESYVFGYPMVIMDLTKKVSTNVVSPLPHRAAAPINQLSHNRNFPDHTFNRVVKPNVDTYYSTVWFDLSAGPQVLSMPATERYYLLPFMDAYSNVFASPGTRTTGTGAHDFLIVGPNWDGEVAEQFDVIRSPTEMAWLIARIQVNSPEDGATVVKAIQDKMALVPLSGFGDPDYSPPLGEINDEFSQIVPAKTIRELDVNDYLTRLSNMMIANPPKAADSLFVQRMAKIGFIPGQPFSSSTDNLILKTKLGALPDFIHKRFEDAQANPNKATMTNGWTVPYKGVGTYGVEYLRRAYVGFVGLGACIPEDAFYPNCVADANGDPLHSSKRYQIHFNADQIPPVNAFWSLTAYNEDLYLVENELNRFALGDRDDMKYNEDGSLDLYIQSEAPTDHPIENWLPIPDEGAFSLTMRLYWPKERALSGEWEVPHVVPVE